MEEILRAYSEDGEEMEKEVVKKLKEVRQRGRKRDMVG